MSFELQLAGVVRQIIAEAWSDPAWKEQLKKNENALPKLKAKGFEFPYEQYYPDIRVVECIPGQISYIVLPPMPKVVTGPGRKATATDDLAMVAARGNTVLGI